MTFGVHEQVYIYIYILNVTQVYQQAWAEVVRI